MTRSITLAGLAFWVSLGSAVAQTSGPGVDNSNSMNPAARGHSNIADAPGTNVPGATGMNPYSGKSVGEPLQPNDLGSPEQRRKEDLK